MTGRAGLDAEGTEIQAPIQPQSAVLGLVPTGSSDYHGPTHKTFAKFGAYETYGLGEPEVPPQP